MQGEPYWWVCNPSGHRRLLEAAGFRVLANGRPYRIPNGSGWARMSLRAALKGPARDIPRKLLITRGAPHAWTLASAGP